MAVSKHPLHTAFPWQCDADTLPAVGGAYVIWISLPQLTALPPRFKGQSLQAGEYFYCGSAFGPGGIRARCGRHLKRDKGKRWHVDWLTTQACALWVLPFPQGNECQLTAQALSAGASVPIPGLGSSDCPGCPSHLLAMPATIPQWVGFSPA